MLGARVGRDCIVIVLLCLQELPQERLLIAGLGCASSEFMFEETREYVKNRKAFGRTLSHLQVRDVTNMTSQNSDVTE